MTVADERRTRAQQNYERNLAERLSAATVVAVAHGPNSPEQLELTEEYSKASQKFESTQSELGDRPPHVRFESAWMFWLPAVAIFVIEAFINKIIIDMAAQTPGGISLLVSAGLSLLLVWLAHNAGVSWRQIWSDLERRIVWSSLIWGLVLLVIVLGMVVLLMSLRAYFALVDTTNDISIFDTVKGIVTSLNAAFIAKAFTVPESLTIGGLNFLALMFSFLFAFFSHDSDKEYDGRYIELKRTRKARARKQRHYIGAQEQVHARFARPISRALRVFVANGGQLSSLEKDDFRVQLDRAERASPQPGTPAAPPVPRAANDGPAVSPAAPARKQAAPAKGSNPW